jgi:hypothetical protein
MSSRNLARRTKAEISFGGIDITKSIQPYLLSISYTDNEEDETDDLQIKIQDRDDLWLTQWLDEISEKLSWASPSGGSASGDAVVSEANKYLGTPYVWGGSSPSGFDCSGLVYYALNEAGINVPRTTAQGYKDMATPVNEATAQPGDLIFFGTQGVVDHVGIYMGNGQMVNATGSCVQITDINTRRAGIISWGRIGGATQSGSAASAQAGTAQDLLLPLANRVHPPMAAAQKNDSPWMLCLSVRTGTATAPTRCCRAENLSLTTSPAAGHRTQSASKDLRFRFLRSSGRPARARHGKATRSAALRMKSPGAAV